MVMRLTRVVIRSSWFIVRAGTRIDGVMATRETPHNTQRDSQLAERDCFEDFCLFQS